MEVKLIEKLADIMNEKNLIELDYSVGKEQIILKKNGELSSKGAETARISEVVNGCDEKLVDENGRVDVEENTIKSTLIGTFYDKPSPQEKPYVEVGSRVKKGDTICIIESMKLMNEIKAPFDCEIKSILVKNEEVVEFSQDLFEVEVYS